MFAYTFAYERLHIRWFPGSRQYKRASQTEIFISKQNKFKIIVR